MYLFILIKVKEKENQEEYIEHLNPKELHHLVIEILITHKDKDILKELLDLLYMIQEEVLHFLKLTLEILIDISIELSISLLQKEHIQDNICSVEEKQLFQ